MKAEILETTKARKLGLGMHFFLDDCVNAIWFLLPISTVTRKMVQIGPSIKTLSNGIVARWRSVVVCILGNSRFAAFMFNTTSAK